MARLPERAVYTWSRIELLADWGFLADPDLPDRPWSRVSILGGHPRRADAAPLRPRARRDWMTDDKVHGVNATIVYALMPSCPRHAGHICLPSCVVDAIVAVTTRDAS